MNTLGKIICLLSFFFSGIMFGQSKIGLINDKDGYVNIRCYKNSKSEIVGRVVNEEYFTFFENPASDWWVVETKTGLIGYVHKSRIQYVKRGYLLKNRILDSTIRLTVSENMVNGIGILVFQLKSVNDLKDFTCRAFIRTVKENKVIDQLNYSRIEPVGGNYGIIFSKKQEIPSLFIGLKFGDYQGEVLLINKKGQITSFEGGNYFITEDKKYLIATWDSDLSGLTIFDLEKEKVVFKEELEQYLSNWYYNGSVYYASLWDGEKEIDTTYQIDFKDIRFKKSNLKIGDGKKVVETSLECYCE